jgi:predicted nucleotidyltransferase
VLREDLGLVAGINDWPGRSAAERLRQWPRLVELAKAAASPPFLGVVLLGSFARGEADDLSDVDFVVFAAEGEFETAWGRRHRLHPADASSWDYPRPGGREVAGHRWLTTDFVLFDGLIATPSGTRLADPMHVLVGNEALTRQIVKREPITAEEQHAREDEITLHEVEELYGQLKLALRAHRRRISHQASSRKHASSLSQPARVPGDPN